MPTAIESEWLYLIERFRREGNEKKLAVLEQAYVRWLERETSQKG